MKPEGAGEIILTNHPEKKKGIQISSVLYNSITEFIIGEIHHHGQVTLAGLLLRQDDYFASAQNMNMNWFIYHVKIDLETKGMIATVYNDDLKISEIRFTSVGIKTLLKDKPRRKTTNNNPNDHASKRIH